MIRLDSRLSWMNEDTQWECSWDEWTTLLRHCDPDSIYAQKERFRMKKKKERKTTTHIRRQDIEETLEEMKEDFAT